MSKINRTRLIFVIIALLYCVLAVAAYATELIVPLAVMGVP